MLSSHQGRAALEHWISWSTWAGLITQTCHLFVSPQTHKTPSAYFWGLLKSLKDMGWQKQDTFFTCHSIRPKSHGFWGQAHLGMLTSPSWTKSGHNQQVPPSPGGAKLWLTPVVGRMLPGPGKMPFLLSFVTMWISYAAFYKDFKEENKTQPVQSPISLPKNQ